MVVSFRRMTPLLMSVSSRRNWKRRNRNTMGMGMTDKAASMPPSTNTHCGYGVNTLLPCCVSDDVKENIFQAKKERAFIILYSVYKKFIFKKVSPSGSTSNSCEAVDLGMRLTDLFLKINFVFYLFWEIRSCSSSPLQHSTHSKPVCRTSDKWWKQPRGHWSISGRRNAKWSANKGPACGLSSEECLARTYTRSTARK